MKVCLRVMGEQLLSRVAAEIARADSAFPRQFTPHVPLQWQIEPLPHPFNASCLESSASHATVMLLEAHDAAFVDELWSISSRDYDAIARDSLNDGPSDPAPRSPRCTRGQEGQDGKPKRLATAPVILVFDRELPTAKLMEMPAIVTDWVMGLDAMHDLARRVFITLKRRQHLVITPVDSRPTLRLESRRLWHGDQAILLTPSEVAVAELFLARFGSVIPLDEIQLLFKLAGRSVEGSNVRVTMFQLRFKIEALTRCHYTLTSAYGQGYVLRHGKAADTHARTAPATWAAT